MKKHLAALSTIFLGVVLAFLAEDLRENRGDRAEEQEIIAGLASDFAENAEQLGRRLEWQERATEHMRALDQILRRAAEGAPLSVPDTLLTALFYSATYDPVRGSVDALLSSGRLDIVRNEELRVAVAGWPSYLGDAVEDEVAQRDFVHQTLGPNLLRLGVPFRDLLTHHRPWVAGTAPEEFRVGSTQVQVTDELRGLVAMRLFLSVIAGEELADLANQEAAIRELLRAEHGVSGEGPG